MGGTSLNVEDYSLYSAYTQPAALGYIQRAQLSVGYVTTNVNIRSFGIIVTDEKGGRGALDSSGVLGGTGEFVALAIPIGSKARPLTIGVVAYFSSDSVSRISGPPVNNPFYPIYQDETRNAAYSVGAGYRVWNGLSLGITGNTSLVSVANYQLQNNTNYSYSASGIEVKSAFSPSWAATYDFGITEDASAGTPLVLGIMRRGKSELKSKLHADIVVQGVPITGDLTSYPHFSPAEWVFSSSYKIARATSLALDIARIEWSQYKNPYGNGNINSYIFGSGSEYAGFHDVWVPRLGAQQKFFASGFFQEYVARVGYFYYPTPVPDQTDNSNYADSDRHGISAGFGAAFRNPWLSGADSLIHIDSFAQFNLLSQRHVVKNSATALGAPGYTIGGNIWVYGLTAKVEF